MNDPSLTQSSSASDERASAASGPAGGPGSAPPRIVLVEDDRDSAAFWRGELKDEGLPLTASFAGPHGAFGSTTRPDFVIYDLGCVGVMGITVESATSPLRPLLDKWPGATFILVSGLEDLASYAVEELAREYPDADILNGCTRRDKYQVVTDLIRDRSAPPPEAGLPPAAQARSGGT